ncbi:MAG: 50S ribosomal protein L28 [Candidatus Omnitrophota bacterium]|jgi:large subunit ribosomal protein L28
MSKVCDICGKGKMAGMKIKRRGMAKKDGGVGRKITGRSIRRFTPNLQKIKVNMKGTIKTIKVCTACIRSGKIVKA